MPTLIKDDIDDNIHTYMRMISAHEMKERIVQEDDVHELDMND